MSYHVYRVSSVGMPRDHHAIFVELNPDQSGHIYQVTGNIQNGMVFEDKPGIPPEKDPTFSGKSLIGTVLISDYERSFKNICFSVEPPKKQFDGPRRLYPHQPIRRCQEWTVETIQALVVGRCESPTLRAMPIKISSLQNNVEASLEGQWTKGRLSYRKTSHDLHAKLHNIPVTWNFHPIPPFLFFFSAVLSSDQ
ncbi:hypothetical protein AJ80_09247 [Polytolypa hystricis UAMH7299]|uniref:Uncharacterized protein n=1 Tax=Polytolypa hystricis (strain UAMH7299) TaxID=1447883 RepID=A0A2B7WTU0_POLH7|nr:hypothetical protein AJ80_09247 [Polytolypa hystricis UAMH7299]